VGLTHKQRAFVAAYAGNATEAAIKAGYSAKTAYSMGQRLLKNVEVAQAINEREEKNRGIMIAGREERQRFWTAMMRDESVDPRARLKASELLGKSGGDFLDRVEHSGEVDMQVNTRAEIRMFLLEREKARADAGGAG